MADRRVKVTLSAQVNEYLAGMDEAAKKTREMGTQAEKLAQKKQSFDLLGRASIALGVAIAAGLTVAAIKASEFDQAMSNVKATSQETTENLGLLRDAALDAGGDTVYTATEAANAVEELGKAGITTSDILSGALDGSLALAASGQLEVARAAEISATTLKQFGLDGTQASHVADVLSAGAGKALGSVEDLAQGLKFVGPVAQSMGVSFEETTAVLALFADQGIIGEQAGTSLRGMLSSLTSPSAQARAEIERLGITLYDQSGKFLGLENAAGQMAGAYRDMDGASRDASLGLIFGNQQVTAASVFYAQGAEGVRDYTEAVDATGYAAQVAEDRLDNLAGDVEKLGGAFDTALIGSGSASNDILRGLTQSATDAIEQFNDMPAPLQGASLGLGAVVSAAALGAGVFFSAVPKVAEYRTALATLGPVGQRAAVGMKAVSGALAVLIALQIAHSTRQWIDDISGATIAANKYRLAVKEGADTTHLLDQAIAGGGAAFGSFSSDIKNLELLLSDMGQAAADADNSWLGTIRELTSFGMADTSLGAASKNLKELDSAMAQLAATGNADEAAGMWDQLVAKTDGSREALDRLKDLFPEYSEAQLDAANVTSDKSIPTLTELSTSAINAQDEIEGLSEELRNFGAANYDVIEAESAFQQAIQDASDALGEDGFTATLDRSTQAGRDNSDMLLATGAKTNEYAAAAYVARGNVEELNSILADGRQKLVDQALAFGETAEGAEKYANELISTPALIQSRIELDAEAALDKVRTFRDTIFSIAGAVPVTLEAPPGIAKPNEMGGFYEAGIKAFASGGMSFPSGVYAGGQNIHKFAETGLPWETYISPKPGHERENIGYALESLSRLGFSGGGAGGAGGSQFTFSPTLVAAPGMSAADVGNIAIEQFKHAFKGEA